MKTINAIVQMRIKYFIFLLSLVEILRSGKEAGIAVASSPQNRACDFHRTRLKPLTTPLSQDAVWQLTNLVDGLADGSSRAAEDSPLQENATSASVKADCT
jgi:hypothetical protein